MNYLKSIKITPKGALFMAFLYCPFFTFSQQIDSTKEVTSFMAAVNVTNNGISLLPNFSLGKPAAIFNMTIGKKRLSFEPEMRFALEGAKPWSFIFWWRYKIVKTNKFTFNVGAHPSFVFREKTLMIDGASHDVLTTQRYFASEFVPTYALTKNFNVCVYYLHSFGLNEDASKRTDFLALRGNISNISLSNQLFLKISPQLYYLNIEGIEGTYVTSTLTLSKKNCPLFISSIMSKAIKTEIAGKDFVWNISLHYAFNKNYISQ
jgi:hypothetical protein